MMIISSMIMTIIMIVAIMCSHLTPVSHESSSTSVCSSPGFAPAYLLLIFVTNISKYSLNILQNIFNKYDQIVSHHTSEHGILPLNFDNRSSQAVPKRRLLQLIFIIFQLFYLFLYFDNRGSQAVYFPHFFHILTTGIVKLCLSEGSWE